MQDDGHFDAEIARVYDRDHGNTEPVLLAQTVDTIARLSGGGPILEFAIGTGRIALPLKARGCAVSGIEMSRPMVDELRRKERGAPIEVVIGDMTSARVPGRFAMVILVYNTIDNLVCQDAQIACFENTAAHLGPGGRFLIETRVPPIRRLAVGQTQLTFSNEPDHIGIDDYDIASQRYSSRHLWISGDKLRETRIPFRYVWPSELDLMARITGMRLEHRWSSWYGDPFTSSSAHHISVWRKA